MHIIYIFILGETNRHKYFKNKIRLKTIYLQLFHKMIKHNFLFESHIIRSKKLTKKLHIKYDSKMFYHEVLEITEHL